MAILCLLADTTFITETKRRPQWAVHSKIKFALEAEHKMVYNTILPKMISLFKPLLYQSITLTLYFLLFSHRIHSTTID